MLRPALNWLSRLACLGLASLNLPCLVAHDLPEPPFFEVICCFGDRCFGDLPAQSHQRTFDNAVGSELTTSAVAPTSIVSPATIGIPVSIRRTDIEWVSTLSSSESASQIAPLDVATMLQRLQQRNRLTVGSDAVERQSDYCWSMERSSLMMPASALSLFRALGHELEKIGLWSSAKDITGRIVASIGNHVYSSENGQSETGSGFGLRLAVEDDQPAILTSRFADCPRLLANSSKAIREMSKRLSYRDLARSATLAAQVDPNVAQCVPTDAFRREQQFGEHIAALTDIQCELSEQLASASASQQLGRQLSDLLQRGHWKVAKMLTDGVLLAREFIAEPTALQPGDQPLFAIYQLEGREFLLPGHLAVRFHQVPEAPLKWSESPATNVPSQTNDPALVSTGDTLLVVRGAVLAMVASGLDSAASGLMSLSDRLRALGGNDLSGQENFAKRPPVSHR